MPDFLFDTSTRFIAFSSMHWYPLLIISVLMIGFIYVSKASLSERQQVLLGTSLAIIPVLSVLARMVFTYLDGTYSLQQELPLHMCRILALIFPFIIYFKNRKWFGITYFFAVVGTMQALLTPDLPNATPHYSYFLYWLLHGVLIFLPIYCIVVFNFRITKKDLINSMIVVNVYLVITLIINYMLGANYFYSLHKPPSASLLDYLGPWPWYLLSVEILAFALFTLAWLPFYIKERLKTKV